MKVILNEDVKHLGEEGDIKDVANGYARNYLFPRSYAVPCNPMTLAYFETRKAEIEAKKEAKRANAASLKEKLEAVVVNISMPAGANGKLYGAVTNQTVTEALHNMGFDVINILANKNNINLSKSKFDAICGTGIIQNEKVMLVKPQTYMNNSGEAIRKIIDFYKEPLENIIVIYDDMDTQIGNIRIRSKGGPGSHNGMKSIVEMLSSENFSRIRVGIGKPIEEFDRINYVIGRVKDEEMQELIKGQELAVEAVEYWLKNGIDNTMNKYNI